MRWMVFPGGWLFGMAMLLVVGGPLTTQAQPNPFRTVPQLVQRPSTTEPPSDSSSPKPVPVIPSPPPKVKSVVPPPMAKGIRAPVVVPSPHVGTPCPVDPPVPIVLIRVRVAACSPADKEIRYHICVENTSPAAAYHVLVRNPLPPNAHFVRASPEPSMQEPEIQWELGTVPGCTCRKIELILQPTGEGDVKNCARVQFEHGQCVVTRIVRSSPLPVPGVPGQGPPPLAPTPDKKPAPGKVKPSPEKPGEKSVPPLGELLGNLDLSIEGPTKQKVNTPTTYTITLKNIGQGPVYNAMIANILPENTQFIKASAPGKFLEDQVAWLLGTMQPGEERQVKITYKALKTGEICNRPFARADGNLIQEKELCTFYRGGSG